MWSEKGETGWEEMWTLSLAVRRNMNHRLTRGGETGDARDNLTALSLPSFKICIKITKTSNCRSRRRGLFTNSTRPFFFRVICSITFRPS